MREFTRELRKVYTVARAFTVIMNNTATKSEWYLGFSHGKSARGLFRTKSVLIDLRAKLYFLLFFG